MKFTILIILSLALSFINYLHANGYLLQVITLSRHGDRAPDVAITKSCSGVFKSTKDVYKKFEAFPGLLTPRGIQRMRDVGSFIGQRYISGDHFDGKWLSNKGFMDPIYDTLQWEFMSREGNRQQMSMSAVALGIFPNVAVPTIVARRLNDNILGGPPPECGARTSETIVKWHETKGKDLVDSKPVRENVLNEVEKICNVSLAGNPVNAIRGGPNPHCWVGDISDTADSWYSSAVKNDPFSTELRSKLTNLAFELEEGSHYEDPRAAIWFTGGFPLRIISSFEQFSADPTAPRPKKSPKMRLHLCSRELFYGLIHMFDLDVQAPGQPHGRVLAGSTFIWELHVEDDLFHPGKKGLMVRSYYWQPGMEVARPMMEFVSLERFRGIYESYVKKNGGPWYEQCDLEHFNDVTNEHAPTVSNPDYFAVKATHEKYIENFNTPSSSKDEKTKTVTGAYSNFLDSIFDIDEEAVEPVPVTQMTESENQVSNIEGEQKQESSSGSFSHFAGITSAAVFISAALYYKKDAIRGMVQGQQRYESIP